jgi:hypothetical protein
MAFDIKKWFMLQMWRVQQIAAILTLALLAISLSLDLYGFMSWRSGVFSSPYTGVPVILLTLGLMIWSISIIWDMRLRMWREQMTVLVERNPYTKEKMTAKEIVTYRLLWIPLLKKYEESDPTLKGHSEKLEKWIDHVMKDDSSVVREVEDLTGYVDGAPLRHDRERNRGA